MKLSRKSIVTITAMAMAAGTLIVCAAPAQATYTGVNGRLVFSVDTGAGFQLFTLGPGGENLRQITHLTTGDAVNADWSPDGRQIAYELDLPDDQGCVIETMRPNGTHVHRLTPAFLLVCEAQPSYTPDGRHLVFEQFDPATSVDAIWIMDLQGRHRRQVTPNQLFGVTEPNVSPDGRTVTGLVGDGAENQNALFSWHLDGTHERQLTPFSVDVAFKTDWSPDGQRLLFSDNADVTTAPANILTMRPVGGGLRQLTHLTDPEQRAYVGSYSPDGRWIVYRFEDHGLFGLYKMHPDGSGNQPILPLSTFRPRFIDWGPQT